MFAMGPAFFKAASAGYATLALTGAFAAATVGVAYSSSIPISGGLEPYSLTGGTGVASGSLDSGFSLSITGTTGARFLTLACASPATADTMTFTASVGSTDGQTATSAQSVTVSASNVMLDLRMTGADGGTSFPDSGPNNFTTDAVGGTHTQLTGVPAGGSGGSATYFDGSGDFLRLAKDGALNSFLTGDFSIEVEAYAAATSSEQVIVGCASAWTGAVAYLLEIRTGGDLRFYAGNSVPMAIFGGAGSFPAAAWNTVKVARVSGVTTLKVNGTTVGSHTGSVNISNNSNPLVGAFPTDYSSGWLGYMRNLKITKG